MQEQWDVDCQRIAQLEQSQRDMHQFMSQFMAGQQSGGLSSRGGDGASGADNDEEEERCMFVWILLLFI